MRIAFITYEYPPDIAKGGIATYVAQAGVLLQKRGIDVEIICGSHTRTITESINGVLIHRCMSADPASFRKDCLVKFIERHEISPFDIIESPEINTNALLIKEKYPLLPMVVKLHMASFIQTKLLNFYTPFLAKLRYFLGGVRRGRINIYGEYRYLDDIEYHFTRMAEGIVAPSSAQKDIIVDEWHIPEKDIRVISYPFSPPQRLLDVPVNKGENKIVTFVGRLSAHKGIVNLIKIIPIVVKKHPDVIFRFIGEDSFFTAKNMRMSDYMRKELKGYENNFIIIGGLDYDKVLEQFETAMICIFPSIWECFGLVCLEAMSAGKAVIGSKKGGMTDILNDGAGILVDPFNVKEIADAVNNLLDNEKLRTQYGTVARKKVLATYNTALIGEQMEAHYRTTIEKSKLKYFEMIGHQVEAVKISSK